MRISDWSSDVCSSDLIAAAEDRNFCGHGAYSADGRRMFATEVVASTGNGVLGIYDVRDGYRRVGEFSTRGLDPHRSEEHTSELQSLMRISYAVFCLKKKKQHD